MDVTISYTPIPEAPSRDLIQSLLPQCSAFDQQKVLIYKQPVDQLRKLVGVLLLKHVISSKISSLFTSDQLLYNPFGRPYFNDTFDFNISHSGGYVIGAFTEQSRVGIDIEKIKPIDLTDYSSYMNAKQWTEIHNCKEPQHLFFQYWAMKEAAMKANGKGFQIDPVSLEIFNETITIEEETWFLRKIDIDPGHPCYIASNRPITNMQVVEMPLSSFSTSQTGTHFTM